MKLATPTLPGAKNEEQDVLALRGDLDQLLNPLDKPLVQGPHLTSEVAKQLADLEIHQDVETSDELMLIASRVMDSHNRLTRQVAEAGRGRPTYAEELKSKDRIEEKFVDHGGTYNKIGDVVRSTIVFDDLESLYQAVMELYESAEIVRVKDRFVKPRKSGYRDLLFNIRMEDPETGKDHITEIQFQLDSMYQAKKKETPKYEARRKKKGRLLELREKQPDDQFRTRQLSDEIARLEGESKAIFDEAWAPFKGSLNEYYAYQRAA